MKTITSVLVVIVFLIIVYKRRISPVISNGKNTKTGSRKSAGAESESAPILPNYPANVPVYPFTGLIEDNNTRYDVMVFDFAESENAVYFSERIDAKLSLTVSEMIEKGYPYRFDFITIGTALLVLVTYRIVPNKNIKPPEYSETNT